MPMQRQGQKSAALARFENYELHAQDLERRKKYLRGKNKPKRARTMYIINDHEQVLDAAWQEIEDICALAGDDVAEMIADHYLGGMTWLDVASKHNSTLDVVKKRARATFALLDMLRDGESGA